MDIKAEHINPYVGDNRPKSQQVKSMFDSIAPAYDVMNRMMTFGIDRLWRAKAVRMLKRTSAPEGNILDVATGTGDLALLLDKKLQPKEVTGIDLSENMIEIARHKSAEAGADGRIRFMTADCLALPFANNTFSCVTVAYGVRNFEHLLQGYREMHRVLRPGGTLCVIELSTPTNRLVRPLYRFYTRHIIPWVGRMVSRDNRAYTYLPESIAAVPQGEQMCSLMKAAGFGKTGYKPLTFGVCTIYMATK